MKLYYIINARIPTEKAHGIQVMKMCEAFARAGSDVTLVVPGRRNNIEADPFSYYGVEKNFSIKYLPVIDLFGWSIPFVFPILTITFAFAVRLFLLRERGEAILYTRGETPFFLTPFLPKRFKLFWETHIRPHNIKWYRKILVRSSGVIVVTTYYQKELITKYNVPSSKILYAADGVDMDMFDIDITKEEARTKLSLPLSKRILVSTSSSVEWKGVPILESITGQLPSEFEAVFVGIEKEGKEMADGARTSYVGKRPYTEIPLWLKAADALLLPGDPGSLIATRYTSPLKLFEYMASKRPIIAFDLPSFRDILNERNAFFIDPSNEKKATSDICRHLGNKKEMEEKARRAFDDVAEYMWSYRAENVLSFINKQTQK